MADPPDSSAPHAPTTDAVPPSSATVDALAALLPAARADDAQARERLARELYPLVRRRIGAEFGRLGHHTVEDLTQEAMARVAARCGQCRARTDAELVAWAYRAARSAALNYLAAPRAGHATGTRLVGLDELSAAEAADPDATEEVRYRAERVTRPGTTRVDARVVVWSDPPASGSPPNEGTSGRAPDASAPRAPEPPWQTVPRVLLCRLAVQAYAELPAPSRELLWRRLVEGAGWQELGRELGTSGPAVKRRFERACTRLSHVVADRLVRLLGSRSRIAVSEYLRAHGVTRPEVNTA